MHYKKIGFTSDNTAEAQRKLAMLHSSKISPIEEIQEECDLILVIGGDGFMLRSLHKYLSLKVPFYGINAGSFGFLMNKCKTYEQFMQSLEELRSTVLYPLSIKLENVDKEIHEIIAFNEVTLSRDKSQAAKISIAINDTVLMEQLICDGIMVATPIGSTAYNLAAGGVIIPLKSRLLALTAISPFRPRCWRGALIDQEAEIRLDVIEEVKRSVKATADFLEFYNIQRAYIKMSKTHQATLLFNNSECLEERFLKEQFAL